MPYFLVDQVPLFKAMDHYVMSNSSAELVEFPVRLYHKDPAGIWRCSLREGAAILGGLREQGTPDLADVVARPEEFFPGIQDGPPSQFIWANDIKGNRALSVHFCIGDDYSSHTSKEHTGAWTAAGFFSRLYNSPGVGDRHIRRIVERGVPFEVKPPRCRGFVHTPYGYVVPDSIHRMVRDYLFHGDLVAAYMRNAKSSFEHARKRGMASVRKKAEKSFEKPSAQKLLCDEIAAATKDLGVDASRVVAALVEEVEGPIGGRNRLKAIQMLMEMLHSNAKAVDALSQLSREGESPYETAQQTKPFVAFSRSELETMNANGGKVELN